MVAARPRHQCTAWSQYPKPPHNEHTQWRVFIRHRYRIAVPCSCDLQVITGNSFLFLIAYVLHALHVQCTVGRDLRQLVQNGGLPGAGHGKRDHVHLPPAHQRKGGLNTIQSLFHIAQASHLTHQQSVANRLCPASENRDCCSIRSRRSRLIYLISYFFTPVFGRIRRLPH